MATKTATKTPATKTATKTAKVVNVGDVRKACASTTGLTLAKLDNSQRAERAIAQAELIKQMQPLSGKTDQASVDAWEETRKGFQAGYVTQQFGSATLPEKHTDAQKADHFKATGAANTAWSRLIRESGLEKPQTTAQKADAERKAKDKPAATAKPATGTTAPAAPAALPASTAKPATAPTFTPTPLEVHLLQTMRKGNTMLALELFAQVQQANAKALSDAPALL